MWGVLTLLGTAPLFYGVLSVLSVIFNWKKDIWERFGPKCNKKVSIVVPLYNENEESVRRTFESLARQRCPKELVEVIVVLEEGDEETTEMVKRALNILEFKNKVVTVRVREGKWKALNAGLKAAKGEVFVIYDAGDTFEGDHLGETLSALEKYDVVTSKVIRKGKEFWGELSYVDTLLWYDVTVPALRKLTGLIPPSGEGLGFGFKPRFPNCLAEDAYLLIEVARASLNIGGLDAVVVEGAPSKLSAFVRQRARWYAGYLQCLFKIINEVDLKAWIRLIPIFAIPLASLIMTLELCALILSPLLKPPLYFVVIMSLQLITLLLAPLYLRGRVGTRVLLVAPMNWALQGFVVIYSVFKRSWYKTERSYS